MTYEFHEIANMFPMMSVDEYEQLKLDIAANGLIEPIILYENKILDGRNRWLACGEVNVTPVFEYYTDETPVSYVISKNLHRRHLNKSQSAMIATDAILELEIEAEKRRLANLKQYTNTERELIPTRQGRSRDIAGEIFNVSGRYIADAEQIIQEAPEYIEPIKQGEMTITQAKREIKRAKVVQDLERIETKQVKEIQGVYDVIVIDPPWQMEKIERDVAPNQVNFDYPTMTIEEISSLDIPCASDCHVWLWTTQKYLPIAFDVLKAWNLKYVCTFVWHKPGGFQPFKLPQYNCEFALYARKGSPEFIDLKDFKLCFDASRNGHSTKPDKFYDLIRRVTAGRRLDMFNRRSIDGFDRWGKEAA